MDLEKILEKLSRNEIHVLLSYLILIVHDKGFMPCMSTLINTQPIRAPDIENKNIFDTDLESFYPVYNKHGSTWVETWHVKYMSGDWLEGTSSSAFSFSSWMCCSCSDYCTELYFFWSHQHCVWLFTCLWILVIPSFIKSLVAVNPKVITVSSFFTSSFWNRLYTYISARKSWVSTLYLLSKALRSRWFPFLTTLSFTLL